ncbi:hypothetical protein HDU98_010212, partial [Podochytrium sp. JEL0797]
PKPDFSAMILYGQSKFANILFATHLNHLYEDKIIVNSLHPGAVETELMRPEKYTFLWFLTRVIPTQTVTKWMVGKMLTAQEGAFASLYAATHKEVVEKNIRGKYIVPYGAVSDDHHPLAMDLEQAQKLWTYSEQVCSNF